MLKVGITGGMGTGKSTVLQIIADKGFPTISADKIVHLLLKKGQDVYNEVVELFGERILDEHGEIARPKLAAIIFADDSSRLKLEAIIHPRILQRIKEEIEAVGALTNVPRAIFIEVPLLFEVGWEKHFDMIWVIAAAENIQNERLVASKRFTPAEINERLNKQMPLALKKQKADVVIENDGNLQDLILAVEKKLHDWGFTFNRM